MEILKNALKSLKVNSLDPSCYVDPHQKWGLFWADTHPSSELHGNPFSSCCVIMCIMCITFMFDEPRI